MDLPKVEYTETCDTKTEIQNECNDRTVGQIKCDLKDMACIFIQNLSAHIRQLCKATGDSSSLSIERVSYYFRCNFNKDCAYALIADVSICIRTKECISVPLALAPDVEITQENDC